MVSHLDKLFFAKHLAMMIKAGLPLKEGVVMIEEQTRSKKFSRILKDVVKRLENGEPLGESLAQYPQTFSQLFTDMIKMGEQSGNLERNLDYLADQIEKSFALKRKVISAMIYPIIILISTFGLGAALSLFILPKLIPFFKSLKVELPLSTKILLFITELIQNYGLLFLAALFLLILFFIVISRLRLIRLINHKIILKIPIAGTISKNLNLALFSRTLGALVKSGIPIVEALDITADTLNNLVYQKEIRKISSKVQSGKKISTYLKTKKKLFPATFSGMVMVGEKTGNLEQSLFYLSEFYGKEVDNTTQRLSTILEPVLLIIIGLIVAFIAVSIISPIYQLTRGLQK